MPSPNEHNIADDTSPIRTDPWTRLHQVFAAKLVLEVFGGGGAIWGFSEVVTFRNPDTLWFWRPCAAAFGAIFFFRFLLQMKDFVNEYVLLSRSQENRSAFRYFQIFSARLVLEVFGGGGAVWGFSEALTLRNSETVEFWRFWAALAGAIFFIRFLHQTKDYMSGVGEDRSNPWLRCVQIFSARMVLEVWGGAGAIWGFSEVVTLRNSDTIWFWRPAALTVGAIFFCRWLLQIIDYWCEVKGMDSTIQMTTTKFIRLYQVFSAKLVLEVFGGGGAVWGFSEALTLRNPDTLWFWRPTALVFGLIFFVRWVMQILDYVLKAKYNIKGYNVDIDEWVRLIQIFSARMVLEVWGGAGAIWGFSEVLTLRNDDTLWFWRPAALTIGAIFFYRWLLQIRDFVMEMSDVDNLQQQLYKEDQNANNNNFTKKFKENLPSDLHLKVDYGTSA